MQLLIIAIIALLAFYLLSAKGSLSTSSKCLMRGQKCSARFGGASQVGPPCKMCCQKDGTPIEIGWDMNWSGRDDGIRWNQPVCGIYNARRDNSNFPGKDPNHV